MNRNTYRNTFKNPAAVCRWIGRALGALLVSCIIFITVGQGLPNPLTQPVGVQIGLLALGLIVIGILAGWRWELSGGALSLLGWYLFVVGVMRSPKGLTWFVVTLALPGALYVTSALLRRYHEEHKSA
jgi:hypothetical protein